MYPSSNLHGSPAGSDSRSHAALTDHPGEIEVPLNGCNIVLKGAVTFALAQAIKRCGSDEAVSSYRAMIAALCSQLIDKWNYAADKYRADHPGVLPPYKLGGPFTRLLPIKEAEIKMATWIPWALIKIRTDFERQATMFKVLTVEQMDEIDAEPENGDYIE
jgi:hypothetical protein